LFRLSAIILQAVLQCEKDPIQPTVHILLNADLDHNCDLPSLLFNG